MDSLNTLGILNCIDDAGLPIGLFCLFGLFCHYSLYGRSARSSCVFSFQHASSHAKICPGLIESRK